MHQNSLVMTNLEDLFIPCQGEAKPKIDETSYEEARRVDLKNLPEGTIVLFSGKHPASNYIVEVLGSPSLGPERDVKLWYVGSGRLTLFGNPACFIGPQSGCLKTKAKNLQSFTMEDCRERKPFAEGILEVNKQYTLPTFGWNEEKELYVKPYGSRIEAYTQIRVPKGLKE